jgi:YD repeat-containing protein
VTSQFDVMGRPVSARDQLGRVTRFGHDRNGRLTTTELATGDHVERRLDARGALLAIAVNGDDTVAYERDGSGRATARARRRDGAATRLVVGWAPAVVVVRRRLVVVVP